MPTDTATDIVFFPINQDEQAKQRSAKNLVAQDVFKKIAAFLEAGLKKIDNLPDLDDLDEHRAHEAILLQGGRGTGKSAVLVNLQLYLEARTNFAKDLLILKPIDPTLLEDGKDMFLDIFIAALVRDKQVKAKLDKGGRDAEAFYDQLCKVGNALESAQSQKEQRGMDKVRALIGSNGIADQIHKLFECTLALTGKKLIVLPIDDVDTALQYAYEKIEIVRKYLVSPYVIPLISGDLDLYNDVIWRDFHGRLLTDSRAENIQARARAKQLSIDYQRKILPLPRRIEVEKLSTYLSDWNLVLSDTEQKILPFPLFKSWLDAMLNERVNGVENSYLPLPITSIREFAQLVSHIREFIPALGKYIGNLKNHRYQISRLCFMKPAVAECIANFVHDYNDVVKQKSKADRNKARDKAYLDLKKSIETITTGVWSELRNISPVWQECLKNYFRHHHNGGAVYLTLEANHHFRICAAIEMPLYVSVFDTDLFKPKKHSQYNWFSQSEDIRDEWRSHSNGRIPLDWTKNFPQSSILPYPRPEIGRQINGAENALKEDEKLKGRLLEDAELVRRLMTHYNFYNRTNRATLVLTGRIFELVITSLIRNVSEREVLEMIYHPPFFSLTEMVSTKSFDLSVSDEPQNDGETIDGDYVVGDTLSDLVNAINDWRAKYLTDLVIPPHARLIYNVVNKYFNQANYFNSPKSEKKEGSILDVFGTAVMSFNAIWATFASFEKGPIFGFDDVIAYMNVSEADKEFIKNQLYRQNILPFLRRYEDDKNNAGEFYDFRTGAYTYMLASHPLRNFFESTYNAVQEANPKKSPKNESGDDAPGKGDDNSDVLEGEDYNNFNSALRRALRRWKGATLNKEYIYSAELDDLKIIEGILVRELNKDGGKWLGHLGRINKYKLDYAGSSIGRVQRILLQIEKLERNQSQQSGA